MSGFYAGAGAKTGPGLCDNVLISQEKKVFVAPTASDTDQIGSAPVDFQLTDTRNGQSVSLADCRGEKGLLAMFLCNHCPYVRHLEKPLAQLCREYSGSGVGMAAISANDPVNYPDDHPDRMRERAAELDYCFPYLFDESQQTARAWGAACTPEFYLYDADLKCVYHGRFDDSMPSNGKAVTGADLRAALDALLAGQPPLENQYPSMGCSIKWRN